MVSIHLNGQNTGSNSEAKTIDYGLGGNFFFGYGIYNGDISKNFSNPFYIGIALEFYKKDFVFQFEDYIGFGITHRAIFNGNDEIWKNKGFVLSNMIHLNIGYSVVDNNAILVVPTIGIGYNKLASSIIGGYNFSDKNKPALPHIKIGTYIDLKRIKLFKNSKAFREDGTSPNPRLSFGLNLPIGKTKNIDYYNGTQFYITLGIGGSSRNP